MENPPLPLDAERRAAPPQSAEGALHASGELLRLLLENSSDGVNVCELAVVDGRPTRRLVFCNDRFVEMSGRSREELMACADLNALTQEQFPGAADNAHYLAEIRAGRPCQGTGAWNRPDGRSNAHEWVAVPMPVREKIYLLGVDRDVTERNRALAALEKERNEALAIFNSAPVAIWCKDTENRILRLNAEAARAMGRRISEVQGRSATEVNTPEEAAAYQADDQEVIRTGMPKLGIVETIRSSSGQVRWIQTDKVPSRDETGQIVGVIVFSQDITAIKQAEESRLLAERRLQQAQKSQSLGALAGGVAHDFNNLLTSVLGKVSLARAGLPASSPVQRHLEGIESASRRAAELCRQMLAYSGHARFEFQRLDLRAFVEGCLPLLRLSIGRGVSLELAAPGEGQPCVLADPGSLRQVLVSLVTNAAEACEGKPDGVIHLHVGLERDFDPAAWGGPAAPDSELPLGDCALVEISDNGCGMDTEVRARMFDPFFSTKFTGRGLGLAAAAGIVRGHRGALHAQSEMGQGAIFRLLLPYAAEAPSEDKPTPQAAENAALRAGAVLVIDDEEPIRLMTASMLDVLGFPSLQTGSGPEALALFEENAADIAVILLDAAKPGVDAQMIFQHFQRLNPVVKMIFVGAAQMRPTARDKAGFLKKPFTLDDLRKQLQALIPAGETPGRQE